MAKRFHSRNGPTQRQLRVGEMLRRELADLIAEGPFNDPDLPQVSVTVGEVRLSPDLRQATVFVLPLGGDHADQVVLALNRESRDIRRLLNSRIHLKHSPRLQFVADPMFDRIDRMQQLFEQDDVKRDLAKPPVSQES